jgi:hypothetical protein
MFRIEGPLANMDFQWSFGFDIRIANARLQGSECQIHSTSTADLKSLHYERRVFSGTSDR